MLSPSEELVFNLIVLVRDGKIQAVDESNPFSPNRFVFSYAGVRYATEWLRDDKPTLIINSATELKGYEIQPLIHELMARFQEPGSETLFKEYTARQEQEKIKREQIAQAALERLKFHRE